MADEPIVPTLLRETLSVGELTPFLWFSYQLEMRRPNVMEL
jgi:hypothetical protein